MRQNAGPIRALAGFKRFISVIKYQELMPDPFDPFDALWSLETGCRPFLGVVGNESVK